MTKKRSFNSRLNEGDKTENEFTQIAQNHGYGSFFIGEHKTRINGKTPSYIGANCTVTRTPDVIIGLQSKTHGSQTFAVEVKTKNKVFDFVIYDQFRINYGLEFQQKSGIPTIVALKTNKGWLGQSFDQIADGNFPLGVYPHSVGDQSDGDTEARQIPVDFFIPLDDFLPQLPQLFSDGEGS